MIPANICKLCIHQSKDDINKCEAYPNGIPAIIFDGRHDHHERYTGDNGILFSPVEKISTNTPEEFDY